MSATIAIIFDFDDTLAPDSTSGFLESIGVNPASFWRERVQPRLAAGWDPIPAYLFEIIEESRRREPGDRITNERLRAFASSIEFFPGVAEIFDILRESASEIDPTVDVEFYLISSGIEEILCATSIAREFRDIWGCAFHTDGDDEIVYPRNIVTFTEKTRLLFQISKGLVGPGARGRIAEVNRKVRGGRFRIPIEQMIFVGDGQTDIPCFALVRRYGGVPIGVYDAGRPSKWDMAWNFIEDNRVMNLHSARFRPGDDLHNTLIMAVRSRAQLIRGQRDLSPSAL